MPTVSVCLAGDSVHIEGATDHGHPRSPPPSRLHTGRTGGPSPRQRPQLGRTPGAVHLLEWSPGPQ